MNMPRTPVAAALFVCLTGVAFGQEPTGSVLYLVPMLEDEAYIIQMEAAKNAATRFPGVQFEFTAGTGRSAAADLIAKIESGVARGVDVIVVDSGATGNELLPAARKAQEAGVKLIANGQPIPGLEAPQIGFDNHAGAIPGGKYMAEHLSSGDKIVIIRCFAGNAVTDARESGFREGLEGSGVEIVAVGDAHCDAAEARALMENWITVHPDLAGVFSDTDIALIGALQALKAAQLDPVVVGHDGLTKAVVEMIAAGDVVDATVILPYAQFGVAAVDTAAALLLGESVPELVEVSPEGVVTKDTAADYIAKNFVN